MIKCTYYKLHFNQNLEQGIFKAQLELIFHYNLKEEEKTLRLKSLTDQKIINMNKMMRKRWVNMNKKKQNQINQQHQQVLRKQLGQFLAGKQIIREQFSHLFINSWFMIETLLQICNGEYPFDQEIKTTSIIKAQDLQYFSNKQQLVLKKNQMRKAKAKFQCDSIVHLINVFQQQLTLHYIYQWVPVSLKNFIEHELEKQDYKELKEINAKLLFSKMIAEINGLTSNLIKLGIQTQMSYRLLGVQSKKIKIFIDKRCRIGKRSYVFLKEYYRSQKYQLIKHLQEDIIICINKAKIKPNFTIKNNSLAFQAKRPVFNRNIRKSAINTDINSQSFILSSLNESKDFDCNASIADSHILSKQCEKQRKFSQPKIDKKGKNINNPINLRNSQSSALKNLAKKLQNYNQQQKEEEMNSKRGRRKAEKSYSRSKSIKIQMQASQIGKKRKESYKMIVTTCHEYQTDKLQLNDVFKKASMFESTNQLKRKNSQHSHITRQKLMKAKQKAETFLKRFFTYKQKSQL